MKAWVVFVFFVCVLILMFLGVGSENSDPPKNPMMKSKSIRTIGVNNCSLFGGAGGFREIRWNPKTMGIESSHHLNSMRPQGMRVLPGVWREHSTGSFKKRGRREDFGHGEVDRLSCLGGGSLTELPPKP